MVRIAARNGRRSPEASDLIQYDDRIEYRKKADRILAIQIASNFQIGPAGRKENQP